MKIELQAILERCHIDYAKKLVEDKTLEVSDSDNYDYRSLLLYLSRYANFNAWFGSSVAILAGKIGRSRGIFLDPSEPILEFADRNILVASYFFDAARDEFDDRDTEHRDTHRCLAQACLKGIVQFIFGANPHNVGEINRLLLHPEWFTAFAEHVSYGYGVGTPNSPSYLFRSMGFHLGSEILADQEFSIIDQVLRQHRPNLVEHLENRSVTIAGQEHNCYAWVKLHSGHGSAKEVEHFEAATKGTELALSLVREEDRAECYQNVLRGIEDFARAHREFFQSINRK